MAAAALNPSQGANYNTIDSPKRRVKQRQVQTRTVEDRTDAVSKCYFTSTHCNLIGASLTFGMWIAMASSCFLASNGCISIGFSCGGEECLRIQNIIVLVLLAITTTIFIGAIACACACKSEPCCKN